MKKFLKKDNIEQESDSPTELLRRTRVSFIVTSDLLIVFAESYGYLEHYYINDPVIGKNREPPGKGWHSPHSYPNNRWTLLLLHISNDDNLFSCGFWSFLRHY
jgi:hypothetical protein